MKNIDISLSTTTVDMESCNKNLIISAAQNTVPCQTVNTGFEAIPPPPLLIEYVLFFRPI